MKITLINGPSIDGSLFMREGRCTQKSAIWSTQWPPISLAYLAAVAERLGHTPRVYDCPADNISLPGLRGLLRSFRPDLCLIGISTPSIEADLLLARAIKKTIPNALLGGFGVHVTALDVETLTACPELDFVIRNEPESTFGALLDAIGNKQSWTGLEGISYRAGGELNQNPDRPFLGNLDSLPYPAWHYIDLNSYRMPFRKDRFVCLTPFRGCPYRCSFCTAATYYGHKARYRSIDSVIGEIKQDRLKYGIDDFFMWVETFTLKRQFVLDLCKAMKAETPGIRWTCNSRTDTVDEEMLVAMKQAGCWMVGFGFESTNPIVLERMKKGLRHTDYSAPLHSARKAGLMTLGHFILGMPGDTPGTMKQTIRDALNLDLDFVQFYAAAPFAGSLLFAEAKDHGYLNSNTPYEAIGQSSASLELPGLAPRQVDKAKRSAVLKFYLRPKQVARLIRFAGLGLFLQLARLVRRRLIIG